MSGCQVTKTWNVGMQHKKSDTWHEMLLTQNMSHLLIIKSRMNKVFQLNQYLTFVGVCVSLSVYLEGCADN